MIEKAKKWIAEHRNWLGNSQWWVEHGVDVANLAVTVFLAFLIHSLDTHDRRQDDALQAAFQRQQQAALRQLDDDQRLGIRQSSAENDSHQAFVLYSEIISNAADEAKKRAIALAIKQYASQNRLYQPSTNMFLESLRTECDQQTFERLRDALDTANRVPRKDAITDYDLKQDSEARSKAAAALDTALTDRSRNCGTASALVPPATTKSIDVPAGYFDVGCNEANRQTREVPLSDDLRKTYKIVAARAFFTSTSNLNASNASTVVRDDSVLVQAYLEGLPKSGPFQLNCAGGGHGTLIVHMELAPK